MALKSKPLKAGPTNTLEAIIKRQPSNVTQPELTEGAVAGRRRGRETVGKRSNPDYVLMGVYVPEALKVEFEIICKRARIDNSQAVENLLRGVVAGEIKFSTHSTNQLGD